MARVNIEAGLFIVAAAGGLRVKYVSYMIYKLPLTFEPGTCQPAKLCDRGHIHPQSQFGLNMTNDQ